MAKTQQRVSDERILQDLKTTAKQVEGALTQKEYREKGYFSVTTVKKHFDTWNEAKEEADLELSTTGGKKYHVSDEEIEWFEEAILDNSINGRFTTTELCKKLVEHNPALSVTPVTLSAYIEKVNSRDNNLRLNRSKTSKPDRGKAKRNVFVKNMNVDRWKKYKDKLPEESYELFDKLVSTGRSPKTTAAALTYLTNYEYEDGLISKAAAANRFGTSRPGINNVLSHLDEEYSQERRKLSCRGEQRA